MNNNNNINNTMNNKIRVVARVNSQSDNGAYEVNYLERMIFSIDRIIIYIAYLYFSTLESPLVKFMHF